MLKRLTVLLLAVMITGATALSLAGCGDDSSDSTAGGGLYGGSACQDDLASAGCIEEVEEKTGEAVEQGAEKLDEEQAEDLEEFENEEGAYGSGEDEYEYVDPSETVKPPSEK